MSDHSAPPATVDATGEGVVGDPIPDPGMHEHEPRPTDVDERAEKRAERQIAALFGVSALFTVLFVVAYFAFEIGDEPTIILGYGASNVALGTTLGVALLCIGVGGDPVGPQADERRRDRRDASPRPLQRRGPRGRARRPSAPASTTRASPAAR